VFGSARQKREVFSGQDGAPATSRTSSVRIAWWRPARDSIGANSATADDAANNTITGCRLISDRAARGASISLPDMW
jgi:hypothetical protein